MKPITIKDFLKTTASRLDMLLMSNLCLLNKPINLFNKEFGTSSPEEVLKFIQNPENAFVLGKFGFSDERFYGFNGFSYSYNNTKCTCTAKNITS